MTTPPELYAIDDDSISTSSSDSSSEEAEFESLDECLEAYSLAAYIHGWNNKNKRQRVNDYVEDKDMRPLAFVCFNTRLGKPKPVTIRALLDSGASESLINKKYVTNLRVQKSSKSEGTVWSTPGGDLHTNS